MSDEDWVKAAMTDDSVVVELLVRLHHSTPPPSKKYSHLTLPLEWSVRQRRSKPIPHLSKKKKPTPRSSPTTPLSWSGSTSASDGSATAAADSFEDSSLSSLKRLYAARSKVTATNETTTKKRTRKKKTLAELKEEEILLVKERRHLKRELAMLRVNVEKQRATNESLKRLKFDLESQPAVESVATIASIEANPDLTQQKESPSDLIHPILPPEITTDEQENQEPNISSQLQPYQENQFEVPDLNLPLDDNFNSRGLI